MITRRTFILLLLFVSCSAIAQTEYYYYKGKKIPLTINENKVCVSIPKTCGETSDRILANCQVLAKIGDSYFNIFIISRSDYEKLTSLDSWEEDVKSVIMTPSYFTESGEEVFSSPYLNVRLKREQDIDLLTSYAEKYRLRIAGSSYTMPVWFILSVTQDSEKKPLECANELWESGEFASSAPDLVLANMMDEAEIRVNTTATKKEPSEIYDLQGRKTASEPTRGIYIQEGCKRVVR